MNKIDLTSEMASMKKGLNQLGQLLGDDTFIDQMHEFGNKAQIKFDQIEQLYNESESSYQTVLAFYGESKSTMQPNEFFKIFSTFTSHWQVLFFY